MSDAESAVVKDEAVSRVLAALRVGSDTSYWENEASPEMVRDIADHGPMPPSVLLGFMIGLMFSHWWPVKANQMFYELDGEALTNEESTSYLIAGILAGEINPDELEPIEHITLEPGESVVLDVNRIVSVDGGPIGIEPVDVDAIGHSLEGVARAGRANA